MREKRVRKVKKASCKIEEWWRGKWNKMERFVLKTLNQDADNDL
jgi:hypothetical protein